MLKSQLPHHIHPNNLRKRLDADMLIHLALPLPNPLPIAAVHGGPHPPQQPGQAVAHQLSNTLNLTANTPNPPSPSPQFMVDHIHPNNLGKKLFADILAHPILRARGDLRALEARPDIQLPARAMTPGGGLLYNKQCYMVLDPRMQHMMDVRKISKGFLPIVKSRGWSLVFHDKGNTSGDAPPLKPGGLTGW